MIYRTLIFAGLIACFLTSQAQLSSFRFNNELKIKFSLRFAAINTTGVPEDSVKDIRALLIRPLEMDRINHEGYQASHRWAMIMGAFTLAAIDAMNGGDFKWGEKNTSTSIGDFIFGWHNHAWNILATEDLSISGGFHWGDYFFGYEPFVRASQKLEKAKEPAGRYGALGPVVMADYNISNRFAAHVETAYALTKKFQHFPEMTPDDPNPHFINITAQLRTNTFLYGGLEYVRSLTRGTNDFNASRTDIYIGVWF